MMSNSSQQLAEARQPGAGTETRPWESHGTGKVITTSVIVLAAVLMGNRDVVTYNITLGSLFVFALLPLWGGEFRRYKWGAAFLIAWILSLVSGLWLGSLNTFDREILPSTFLGGIGLTVGFFSGIMFLMWAKRRVQPWILGMCYGIGMMTSLSTSELAQGNMWKFSLALPVTIILLSICWAIRNRWPLKGQILELSIIFLLAVMAMTNDARSIFASLTVVSVLAMWQLLPKSKNTKMSILRMLLSLALVLSFVYNLGSMMMLEGMLGEAAKQRSEMQLEMSGSLIVGGRPEMAATVALMSDTPSGFGLGIIPNLDDIVVAKEGMSQIGYDPDNGYVEKFMFGNQFELHSTAGDFWATMGIPGLLLALGIGIGCVRWLVHSIALRQAPAVMIYLAVYSLWSLFFSPFYSSVSSMLLFLGLAFALKESEPVAGPITR